MVMTRPLGSRLRGRFLGVKILRTAAVVMLLD